MCRIIEKGGGRKTTIRYRQHSWGYNEAKDMRRCECGAFERLAPSGNWVPVNLEDEKDWLIT